MFTFVKVSQLVHSRWGLFYGRLVSKFVVVLILLISPSTTDVHKGQGGDEEVNGCMQWGD
jgi:hypothetical protein